METFIVMRESIISRHDKKLSSVLFEVDFSKAFDIVSWEFLLKLLKPRGFPGRWVLWIKNLLISSSSFIKVNGVNGPFYHYRGLRQGDRLSLMLFILVADTL